MVHKTEQENLVFTVHDLTKHYKKKTAVNQVSFGGKKGEIIGFLGPNGAGKTTTIKMMTGLVHADAGTVQINGYDISKQFEKAISGVGAIVEIPYLYEHLTGEENLSIFAGAKGVEEEIPFWIEQTELGTRIKDKVSGYSLGMKQRLGIAVALLGKPSLLILDEPTNGLDPIAIRNLRTFLKKLSHEEGICILISSHMLWEMEKLCDRVLIITNGTIIGEVEIETLKEQGNNLEDYYVSCVEETVCSV